MSDNTSYQLAAQLWHTSKSVSGEVVAYWIATNWSVGHGYAPNARATSTATPTIATYAINGLNDTVRSTRMNHAIAR